MVQNGWKKKWQFIKRNYQLYLMMLPGLILLILFKYVPMYGLIIAFQDYNPRKGILGSKFIGFENFQRFFSMANFDKLLYNTILISILSIIVGFIAPIILALLLNQIRSKMVKKNFQLISYAPNFISTVIVCGMLFIVLSPVGPVNSFLIKMGIDEIPFMTSNEWFVPVYLISNVWQSTGWSSIIYTAALANVSNELIEAADLDGASILQKIWYIEIPAIKPVAVVLFILSVGGVMSIGYEKAYLMQTSLNIQSSEILPTYLYKVGLQMGDYSYSTAVGLFNAVINLILIVFVNRIVKHLNEGEGL